MSHDIIAASFSIAVHGDASLESGYRITHVPSDIPLVAGMTATVMLDSPRAKREVFGLVGLRRTLDGLFGWTFDPPADAPAQACDISSPISAGHISVLTEPEVAVSPEARQVNPGLAPGLAIPPAPRSIDPEPRPMFNR